MGKLLIVANWKSNKTTAETKEYLVEFSKNYQEKENVDVVLCPSFTSIPEVADYVDSNNLKVALGAQDVSPFEEGAFTGEVSAQQVKEFCKHVIIGHSERRINFNENDEILNNKVARALTAGLEPIFCVQNEDTAIPSEIKIVAYEPIEAIGSGNPDTPENAQRVANQIKDKNPQVEQVLYGGSVSADNVASFVSQSDITGVLVGGASLDPIEFASIIKQC